MKKVLQSILLITVITFGFVACTEEDEIITAPASIEVESEPNDNNDNGPKGCCD